MALNVWPTDNSYPSLLTAETISGVRAVQVDTSGHLRIAMPSVSGRMPAVGIVADNVASGISVIPQIIGLVQFPNGGSGQTVDFSGAIGSRIWVGPSGQLITSVGARWTGDGSGGWLSGSSMQPLGIVVNSGGVILNVIPMVYSGSISSGWNLLQPGVF